MGSAFGTLIGGYLTDLSGRLSPDHGRVFVAQTSVGSGLVLFPLVFYALPIDSAPPMMLLTGLLITWCECLNNTIVAEVVSPRLRTTIYGLERLLTGIIAPAGGLAAGWVAETFFGFSPQSGCGADGDGMGSGEEASGAGAPATDADADALGSALGVTVFIPWAICLAFYSCLHCTYPADRRRHRAARGLAEGGTTAAGGAGGPRLELARCDTAEASSVSSASIASAEVSVGLRHQDQALETWRC